MVGHGKEAACLPGATTTSAAVICRAYGCAPLVDACVCTAVPVERQARATKGSTRHIGEQQRVVPVRNEYVLEMRSAL